MIDQPQPHSKEVVLGTAPQHRGKHSPSVNAFHTSTNPAPHQGIMTMFSVTRRKTHISQTAGFTRTPVQLSLIIYSLFHIHLTVGFTTYNYCSRKIKGVGGIKGNIGREGYREQEKCFLIAINYMRKTGQRLLENIRNYIWIKAKKKELDISCETLQSGRADKAFTLSHCIVCLQHWKV